MASLPLVLASDVPPTNCLMYIVHSAFTLLHYVLSFSRRFYSEQLTKRAKHNYKKVQALKVHNLKDSTQLMLVHASARVV